MKKGQWRQIVHNIFYFYVRKKKNANYGKLLNIVYLKFRLYENPKILNQPTKRNLTRNEGLNC